MSNVVKQIARIDPLSSQNISIGVNYEASQIYFSEGSNGKGDTKVKTFKNKSSVIKDVKLNPSFYSGTPFIVSGDLMYYMGSMDATMYVIDMTNHGNLYMC
jgi:glutamine cyclotransferase